MYLVYLHLYEIHKRDFYCFFYDVAFLPSLDLQQMSLYLRASFFILKADLLSSIPVFFAAGGFHVIFQHPLLRIISSISTLCQIVTLLHSMNVVCPEIRVKGLAPIDSFRFLAFILLL